MAKRRNSSRACYPLVEGFTLEECSSSLLLDGEEWKTIPLFDGEYEASNYGRLRTKERFLHYTIYGKPVQKVMKQRLLRCVVTVDGYLRIVIKHESFFVHRLVLLAWTGKSDLQVNHKNCNKQDNRIENLEYVTQLENMRHAVSMGRLDYHDVGKNSCEHLKNYQRKPFLSKEQVLDIRRVYSPHKITIKMLEEKYNCCEKVIRDAIKGRNAYKYI